MRVLSGAALPRVVLRGAAFAMLFVGCSLARAGSLDLGNGVNLDYKLTANYSLAVRVEDRASGLIDGGTVPLQFALTGNAPFPNGYDCDPAVNSGTCIRFLGTGLPRMINFDDGDRNFKPGSIINNRLSLLGEMHLTWKNYGWISSATGFYDNAYNQPNANNSPGTVNKYGEWNEFTEGARHYDGRRAHFLENYVYADWNLPWGMYLDLRAGKQLVTWGESLFFGGIASTQGPNDAAKAFVPGAEIKDILLPVNQVAAQLQVTENLTLLAQYKLQYKSTELFPVGDFYSTQDEFGPGGTFAYGSTNPLYFGTCVFKAPDGTVSDPCKTILDTYPGLLPIIQGIRDHYDVPPNIIVPRIADDRPSDFGQYGFGVKYQVTSSTNMGLYYLRYHDTNPAGAQQYGYAPFVPGGCLYPFPLPEGGTCLLSGSTELLGQKTPINYRAKYYDGIHLIGTSFSTTLGPFNVAGEVNYRYDQDMPIQTLNANVLTPYYVRGKEGQVLVSAIYAGGPTFLWDENNIVAEAGYTRILGVDSIDYVPGSGLVPIQGDGTPCNANVSMPCSGDKLFFSKNTWGFEVLSTPTIHNVINGWDLSMPTQFLAIMKGNPEVAGQFGPALGEGDQRISVGFNMTYLGNLELGIAYNIFLGSSNVYVHDSFIAEHPLTDRDNVALHAKYTF